MKAKLFCFVAALFFSWGARALDYGCQLKPNQLNEVGTRFVKMAASKNQSLPNSITITSNFYGEWHPTKEAAKNKMRGTVEGFYRPEIDDYYSITPLPFFGVAINRDRNVIYICAHIDQDPKKTHFTAYMMRGFDMDPTNFGNFVGDLLSGPSLTVKPLPASLIGISEIRKKFLFWLHWFPFFNEGIEATDSLQRFIVSKIGDFTGIGVERITLTKEFIEIASGINLNDPTDARMIRKIQIGSAED